MWPCLQCKPWLQHPTDPPVLVWPAHGTLKAPMGLGPFACWEATVYPCACPASWLKLRKARFLLLSSAAYSSPLFQGLFERGGPGIWQASHVLLKKIFVPWGGRFLVLSSLLLFDSDGTLWMKRFFLLQSNGGKASAIQERDRRRCIKKSQRGEEMNSWEDQRVDRDPVADQW